MTDKALFIPIQRRPNPETGRGGERALTRAGVELLEEAGVGLGGPPS